MTVIDRTATEAIARVRLEEVDEGRIVLSVPGTDYRLALIPTVPASEIDTPPGKRIRGVIEARSLRMHVAGGGGRFIEPVNGAPRIVAGAVLATDEVGNRLLVDAAVPMWVAVHDGQSAGDFRAGQLVNFYVESGTSFTPVDAA